MAVSVRVIRARITVISVRAALGLGVRVRG